jgi:hypothetical protein
LIATSSTLSILAAVLPQMISPTPPLTGWRPNSPAIIEGFFRLTINPTGDVERCTHLMVSPPAEPTRMCELVSSIKFVPAKDSSGQPLYSLVTAQFQWTPDGAEEKTISPDVDLTVAHLPSGATVHPIVKTAVLVDSDGKVEGCSVAETSGIKALDNVACKAGLAAEALQPAKDKTGANIKALQALSVGFGAYAQVVLQKDSAYAALGAAGPYFPERAQRLNVSGSVIIECAADSGGVLTDCTTKEEVPKGFGFAQAAQKMAQTKWMKAAPGSGDHVVIQIAFPASRNFRIP